MKLREMKIESLRPAPYNPRVDLKPADAEYQRIKESILRYGQAVPLVYTSTRKYILGGAQRLKVMRDLGYKKVFVVTKNIKDLKEEKAFNMALNKVGGLWDPDGLTRMKEEGIFDPDADVFTGFTPEEVEAIGAPDEYEAPEEEETQEPPGEMVFQVVVECTDREHQQVVFADLASRYSNVRVVTI